MNATHGNIRHSKLFKIIILLVYMYSFIQLDADESPIFGQRQECEPAIEEPSS
jgi:hypothetical protein